MFKIGDFSKLTHVSIRMLRYYDEQNLLKPALVDEISLYRYYSAKQMGRLFRIVYFRDLGFGTAEIHRLLTADDQKKSIPCWWRSTQKSRRILCQRKKSSCVLNTP